LLIASLTHVDLIRAKHFLLKPVRALRRQQSWKHGVKIQDFEP
jgi:hypothetical protein